MKERTQPNPLAYLEQEGGGSGFQIAHGLLRRKWIIVFCLAVGCGVGYLQYRQSEPVYQTGARILIIKEDSSDMPVQAMTRQARAYEEGLATQIILLRSPLLLEQAIKHLDIAAVPVLAYVGDPVSVLLGGLEVKRADEKASVLDLTFKCGDPVAGQTILNAIITSYEEFLQETHNNVSKETVDLITQAKGTLMGELQRKQAAYREFRESTPLIWTKEGSFNIHQARLNQIEATRSGLIISRSQTKAQLQSLEAAIERGGSREAILLMVDKSSPLDVGGSGKLSVAGLLFPLLLEEQMLLEDYGPDHPKVRAIRKRIDLTRKHLRSNGIDEPLPDVPQENAGPTDFVNVYLESLWEDLRSIDEKQKELNELFLIEAAEAKKLANYENTDETLREDIDRTHQLVEVVVKRLEEINLIQDYGKMKTRVLCNAVPGWKVGPLLSRSLGFSGTMGFFAGCLLAFLLEMADKRFRSPDEIAEKLGVPVIGHIPYYKLKIGDEASAAIDGSICVYHRPKSLLAEAYRGIRTALYFSTRGEGHKVIQVSSPNPGDGKSTMAANLSATIAQSGKRTLLIESDFRRPRVHKLLGIDGSMGLTTVLAGDMELFDAIQETEIENLYAISCGRKPSNPSEILSSPRYAELIDMLRDKFDYVIIDTPPLMAVTDPAVVATRVDGIMMTIRISKRTQEDCLRSAELLSSLGANLLGVIVNGVDNHDGGYGYGKYGYGGYGQSGSGSTYGVSCYSYGYDERYSSYYDDEDEPARSATAERSRKGRSTPEEVG